MIPINLALLLKGENGKNFLIQGVRITVRIETQFVFNLESSKSAFFSNL